MTGLRLRTRLLPWRWLVIRDGYIVDFAMTYRAGLRRRGIGLRWATVIKRSSAVIR